LLPDTTTTLRGGGDAELPWAAKDTGLQKITAAKKASKTTT
jgi:hypothetical protein